MDNFLSDKNLIEGIEKCITNAESLLQDAYILKENKRPERAFTLFQLSIEEIGKASMVYFFATLPEDKKLTKLKAFKKEFLDHKTKTTKAINFDTLILSSIKDKSDRQHFFNLILLEHENLNNFNNLKNYSLYTSIIAEKFLLPSEIITESHLDEIELRATTRLELIKSAMAYFLKNFDVIKKAEQEVDTEQIKTWADEFMADFLSED